MGNKEIYFDHSATTPVRKEVLDAMLPYFSDYYGNASSIYLKGRESKKAVENAREQVADAICAKPEEIYFTASGTEADNWAIKGIAERNKDRGNHIITSSIEHPAVMNTCKYLEKQGYNVTYIPVDENGTVSLKDIENAITDKTILISIMMANNEIGTIEPVKEIGDIARKHGIYFHTDAVQAVGNMKIDVNDMNIDLLTISAHKFYGPKGIGALYIRKGVKIANFVHGGHQERGRRAATENVPAIVGMGEAIKLASEELESYVGRLSSMRDELIYKIESQIPYCRLNGHRTNRLPGHINISFDFIEGESLLLMLDMYVIYCSSGSACTSGSLDPSHVLLAIGLKHETAHGSLRISLGRENTTEDIDIFMEKLPLIVQRLRDMSPLYEAVKNK